MERGWALAPEKLVSIPALRPTNLGHGQVPPLPGLSLLTCELGTTETVLPTDSVLHRNFWGEVSLIIPSQEGRSAEGW